VFLAVKPNLPGTYYIDKAILNIFEKNKIFFSLFSPVVPVEERGLNFQWKVVNCIF